MFRLMFPDSINQKKKFTVCASKTDFFCLIVDLVSSTTIFRDFHPVTGTFGGGGIFSIGFSNVSLVVFLDAFIVPSKFQSSSAVKELVLFQKLL